MTRQAEEANANKLRKRTPMGRRASYRVIRAARTYTIEEASRALRVSVGTVRNWIKGGLPIMKAQRPFLILGEELREFLQARETNGKVKLEPDQFYCLTCKEGRRPMGLLVDCIPQTPTTARLVALCEVCGGTCNRMVSRSNMAQISQIFDVAMKDKRAA